ncbi:uncharacterized protein F54H12.2-like [Convolutriloba macropyga]|uniref:uncharacterized protein F54H12.2-like n=1 Tax=Convolutriloba macropyga TaxID=536237 RepID=UPI003F51F132
MIANLLPSEATHTTLDLFEKPPLLVTFENAFTQKIGPSISPDGPVLEFEVLGDRNNFFDLQKIVLEIKCKITQANDAELRAGTEAANRDTPYFVNNTLHSLFSECTVSANGIKISNTNGNYAHKGFIETEFSHGDSAKNTWLVCQGYYYEDEPQKVDGADTRATDVGERKALVSQSVEATFIGKPACDILTCDKHLLSGVTLRFSFRRSCNEFVTIAEAAAKHYKVKILQANLYVRKMTITDNVLGALEKQLMKTPAVYGFTEVLPRTFLATTGVQSWRQEDVFSNEPVRRMIIAMTTNQAYLVTNRTNPFHYRAFNLSEVTIYRNGLPIVGTPISTTQRKRIYYNTIEALDFLQKGTGHGIPLGDYDNHFIMAFDLTSTQEASHDFIHPELTNCSISVDLTFSRALADNVEILLLGERNSTFYITSDRKVTKNALVTYPGHG